MYTLYIANKNYSSWSLRPWILMRELSIPFTEELVAFEDGQNWDNFRTFSPTGLVPCLVESNNDKNLAVWDSLAITEYLAESYPPVWPDESVARAWARCASAEMHGGFSAIRNQCSMNCGIRVSLNSIDAALQKDLDRIDELWSEGLNKFAGPFLAGSRFTAVDAFFAPVVFRIQTYGLVLSERAMSYVSHILSLSSMNAWMDEALKEVWRDPSHEEDCVMNGKIIEDYRNN